MKYNKKLVMKTAWGFVKFSGYTLSDGLRKAWAFAKSPLTKEEAVELLKKFRSHRTTVATFNNVVNEGGEGHCIDINTEILDRIRMSGLYADRMGEEVITYDEFLVRKNEQCGFILGAKYFFNHNY